ncbi:MAG TPA: M23 family metallopeptidase [Candidatus Binataceae bacterium]|nr:M23 family metallopeptidase [Candidatus Binataceae bacterium]
MKVRIVFIVATLMFTLCGTFQIAAVGFLLVPDIAPPITGLRLSDLSDTFDQMRGRHRHGAIDIMRPEDTPVHAVSDGVIRKLFLSKAGGNTIYEFDDAGLYCYYYAHLDHYAQGLREGSHVSKGDVIGYVGSSGDASPFAPQLHFEIHLLDPKRWWQGIAIDPYPVLVEAIECSLPRRIDVARAEHTSAIPQTARNRSRTDRRRCPKVSRQCGSFATRHKREVSKYAPPWPCRNQLKLDQK